MPTSTRLLLVTGLLALLCLLTNSPNSYAQTITGTVYRDFNSNGLVDNPTSGTGISAGEIGVPGVRVTAINSLGTSLSALTDASGLYTLNVGANGVYRLEFSNPVATDYDGFVSAPTNSSASGSSVRFVNLSGSAVVNYGLNYPAHFCGPLNTNVVTTCFVNGNQTAIEPTIVTFPYNATATSTTGKNVDANSPATGSVWGLAYQRSSKQMFAGAFVRRHAGVLNGRLGAIYKLDYTGPASTTVSAPLFLTLNAGTEGARSLPANINSPSNDNWGFGNVGRAGLGDLDLSDDEQTLFVTNLFDKKLYVIPVGNPPSAPASGQIQSYTIVPSGTCSNDDYQIFATKFYRGNVYVGAVCTAEVSQSRNDLKALVYQVNPQNGVATQVFSTTLGFQRGFASNEYTSTNPASASSRFWRPWTNNFNLFFQSSTFNNSRIASYPQPMLTDIEFDVDGSMILAFGDRTAYQLGTYNNGPTSFTYVTGPGTTTTASPTSASGSNGWTGISGGDLMRVHNNSGTFVVESNASAGGIATLGAGRNEGNGGGEYYWDDRYEAGFVPHEETAIGGLTFFPGSGQVMATVIDPVDLWSGGVSRFNNRTGSAGGTAFGSNQDANYNASRFQVYGDGTPNVNATGKSAGLGDLELRCGVAPVQIGNRVWRDDNDNGIQDAGELALAGITVQLKGSGVPANTTVVTGSNGEYYFSNASGTNATGFVYSLTGLSAGNSYSICFPTSASAGALSLSTKPNQDPNGRVDSKPNPAGIVSFTLGGAGQNTFVYDAAFVPCVTPTSVVATATPNSVAPGAVVTLNASASGVTAGTTNYTWSGPGISSPTATTVASRTITAPTTEGVYAYTVLVSNGVGCTATATTSLSVICSLSITTTSLTSGTLGQPYSQSLASTGGVGSLTYVVASGTLPTGLTLDASTGILSGTPTAAATTNFTLSVTDANGCFDEQPLSITATCPLLSLLPTSLPTAQEGTLYSQTLTASGGTAPYAYSVTAGTPPPGLGLVGDVISGTPTGSGLSSFTVTATDANGCSVELPLSISVSAAPVCDLSVTASASSGTVAIGNSATLTASVSPTGSYTYVWSAPDGVTLETPNAEITDTSALPSGVHTFTVSVTSGPDCSSTATVCVSVPFTACQGSDYAFSLSTVAGYDSYDWIYTAPGSATSTTVQSGSANTFVATLPGEYQVQAFRDDVSSCPDGSCCPVIINEIPAPVAPSLTAVAATCNSQTATVANADAQLILSGTALSGLTYNVAKGDSYTASAPLFDTNQNLPATTGSVLATGLTNPTSSAGDVYTVRIFSGDCFIDVAVTVPQNVCGCPPAKCVPFVIEQVRRSQPGGGGGSAPLQLPSEPSGGQ
ncbi:putative Ig domain-containing protein [Spirosoma montaniterrae]|uniref:PKD/Chitinase domain-containing protein n=1 Tax=Spirosoma montaniterrae TaxID=1178516 RepID=A0A1P9WRA3_9BACT|nr:SdrD B-like domain-containing protein [Spirosoma montaniterrae]AQG77905.1 hypothetical protein AWR27_00170 [Spirosoma montaniterrae]